MATRRKKIDLEAERLFENEKVKNGQARAKQSKFYWATELAREAHNRKLHAACVKKNILEIGCSVGRNAERLNSVVAHYTGIDISDAAIELARSKAIPNSTFMHTDGHQLPFAAATFDCVVTDSLLHHLDLSEALPEIERVLKPGGTLIFFEPLGFNPLFKLYRLAPPRARTEDEQPFLGRDFALIRSHFLLEQPVWSGFLSILSAFLKNESLRLVLTKADQLISRTPLRYMFWQISGVARKPLK